MKTILVVDDKEANREFLGSLLGCKGYHVLEARDGAEALARVLDARPDLVICDILMPTMDGYEFVRQLRADRTIAHTTVIFHTAHYHEREAQNLAKSAGVAHVLTKPCEPELVLRIVEYALAARSESAPPLQTEVFGTEHLRLVTDKLSGAMDELRLANQRLTALIELNLHLASQRDLRQLMHDVCRGARELLGARYGALTISGKETEPTAHFVTSGFDVESAAKFGAPPLDRGILAEIHAKRRACRLKNPGQDAVTIGLPAGFPPVHSLLAAPVTSLSHVYGWMCLTDKLGAEEFSAEDEQLLTILAAQVGRIYENGSLYVKVQRHALELEQEIAERKRIEDEGRETRNFLASIFDNIPNMISVKDARDLRFVRLNSAGEKLIGHSEKELLGKRDHDFFPKDQADFFVARDRESLASSGVLIITEETLTAKDGTTKLLQTRKLPILDKDGSPQYLLAISEDITERQRATHALAAERTLLRTLVDAMPDVIFAKDTGGRFTMCNPASFKHSGLATEAEIIGKSAFDFYPRAIAENYQADDIKVLAGETVLNREEASVNAEGIENWFLTTKVPLRDHAGKIVGIVGISRDITQRKFAEEKLQDSENKYRQLIEQASDGIFVSDAEGNFTIVNSRGSELLGYTENELIGLNGKVTYLEEESEIHSRRMKDVVAGQLLRFERMVVRKDGTAFPAEVSLKMLDSGMVQVIFHDISERKRAEEKLLRFRMALETSPNGIFLMDFETFGYLDVNETGCRMLGYTLEELLRLTPLDTNLDITQAQQREKFDQAKALGSDHVMTEFEGRYVRHKNGTTFPVEVSRRYFRVGDAEIVVGTTRDMSAQKRAEESLLAERTLLRTLVDALPDVVFTKDTAGRFTMCNVAAYRHTGLSCEAQIIGKSVFDLYQREMAENYHADDLKIFSGEPVINHEETSEDASGTQCWFLTTKVPLLDHAGEVVGMVGISRNITEQRHHERKIARLSRIHAVLSGINSAIVRIRDRRELFQEACRIIVEHGRFTVGWISVLDPVTGKLTAVAQAGLPAVSREDNDLFDRPIGLAQAGIAQAALRDRRAVVDNAIEDAPGLMDAGSQGDTMTLRRVAIALGAKSVIVLPLIVEKESFGILTLFAPERGFFDDEELALLNELAGDISFSLEFIAKEEKVAYLAYYDALTGLPNRTLFFERLTHQLGSAAREGSNVALLLIDLDRFRQVNDTLGRHAGDALLVAVAQRLSSTVRDRDSLAKVGSNRFALAVSGISGSPETAGALESRNREWFERLFTLGAEEVRISATLGIAMFPLDAENSEVLFANAEAALRLAKSQSMPFLFYGPEMNARVAESLRIETRLRRAIANHELVLWYQPKINLKTGKITGLEALMRWQDPESGLVPPAKFIPVMEQTGMILDAGNWAMSQVAVDCRLWASQGLTLPRVAVNVSPMQLRQKDFVSKVIGAADAMQTAGSGLDLEITESVIMENVEAIIPKLQTIRGLGVEIYIDDFGTGYSSLAYIAKLPIHCLKIDRSFVVGMTQNDEGLNIVNAVISLAHTLKLRVVAEGVETEEQSTLLTGLACDEMQGYLFSRPVPSRDIPALLRKLAS